MNSGETVLLGSYCPLKHASLCRKGAETEGHKWGSRRLWGSSGFLSCAVDTWVRWTPLESRRFTHLGFLLPPARRYKPGQEQGQKAGCPEDPGHGGLGRVLGWPPSV